MADSPGPAIHTYQLEERTLIARRLNFSREQVVKLTEAMRFGDLSLPEKTEEQYYALLRSDKSFIYLRRRASPGLVSTPATASISTPSASVTSTRSSGPTSTARSR